MPLQLKLKQYPVIHNNYGLPATPLYNVWPNHNNNNNNAFISYRSTPRDMHTFNAA